MAEREGFEPSLGYKPKHDFQSCALDQLSHLSIIRATAWLFGRTVVLYHIIFYLSSDFLRFSLVLFGYFLIFSFFDDIIYQNTIEIGENYDKTRLYVQFP